MKSNVPLQIYVPDNVADWVQGQARKAAVSRSRWVATVLADLYEGRVRDEALRNGQADLQRKLVFVTCALDALLACHADTTLRERVLNTYVGKLAIARSEVDQ
jgi:hypothetical protein